MKAKIGLLAIVVLFFQGCIIHSLYPLYTADILIENKNLEGFWASGADTLNADCPEGLLFEKHEGSDHYHLTLCEEGKWSRLDVHLVKIGEHHYIDFYPDREYSKQGDNKPDYTFLDLHLIPVHSFARINITESQLSLEYFNTEWLEDLFEQRKIRVKHEMVDGNILLTASPKDLQKFVYKYANEKKAFESPDVYQKQL